MHSKSSLNLICWVPAIGKTLDKYRKKKLKRVKMKKEENIDQTSCSNGGAALVFDLTVC